MWLKTTIQTSTMNDPQACRVAIGHAGPFASNGQFWVAELRLVMKKMGKKYCWTCTFDDYSAYI